MGAVRCEAKDQGTEIGVIYDALRVCRLSMQVG